MNEYHPTHGALRAALNLIAYSVKGQGKPDLWVDRILDVWHKETSHMSGDAIKAGAATWIRSEDFRPSLAQFLRVCDMSRGTDEKNEKLAGCADCSSTGWRWLYVHYLPERGRQRCDALTAACTCTKGRDNGRSTGGFDVVQAIAQAKRSPGFIEVHITDRHQPVIPLANRVAPYQWQYLSQRTRRGSFRMDQ